MSRKIVNNICIVFLLCCSFNIKLPAQRAYFVDGYHGGVYGHYPKQYTAFINEMLEKHPNWYINLEIEPETWDTVKLQEPENYALFKKNIADQSLKGRIEYVNPAYGQPYFYNINGESIIRQFSQGINKLKEHFPGLVFTTYSTEEPCFTSALPQILSSFGFKYASLKNPNTCWGGYTRAFGGEMINWVGPDGTKLPTVPRYAVEALSKKTTWETIASTNTPEYLDAAFKTGIANPIGMCLQDAGWRNGPWLKGDRGKYEEIYTTWRNYISNIVTDRNLQDWNFSQEDVLISLVWGSQALQRIARQVRASENMLTRAEKLAAISSAFKKTDYPTVEFSEAWRQLLLAQHHDCWIVPYNGRKGDTWIDKVRRWTDGSNDIASKAIDDAFGLSRDSSSLTSVPYIRVFNTNADEYNGYISIPLPERWEHAIVRDLEGKPMDSQVDLLSQTVFFKASIPGTGYNTFQLEQTKGSGSSSSIFTTDNTGRGIIETDLYRIVMDPRKGGAITSLIAKNINGQEFVDTVKAAGLNAMCGYFFNDGSYFSSTSPTALLKVINNGPYVATIEVNGLINKHSFTQTITVRQSDPLIDVRVKIDWHGSPGIGDEYMQYGGYRSEDYRKAFYNDRKKLQTLFPLNIPNAKIYKDAPFDVTESKLNSTYFKTWDSIKNNVLLNWIDMVDPSGKYGLALFSDHTTGYAYEEGGALGLITQYSGIGLWGVNYSLEGPTEFRYALYPHAGDWNKAMVWSRNNQWNNQPEVKRYHAKNKPTDVTGSLISPDLPGFEITAIEYKGEDLLVRVFNPSPIAKSLNLSFSGTVQRIEVVELDGRVKAVLPVNRTKTGDRIQLQLSKFGISTLLLRNFKTINKN